MRPRLSSCPSLESSSESKLASKSRRLIYGAITAGSVFLAACGGNPDSPLSPDGGTAGQGGTGGTGGEGGTGGTPDCSYLKFDGLAQGVISPGDTNKSIKVDLPAEDPHAAIHNGTELVFPSAEAFDSPTAVGLSLTTHSGVSHPDYGVVDKMGYEMNAFDPDNQYVWSDKEQDCILNVKDYDQAKLAANPPSLTIPGVYSTIWKMEDGDETKDTGYEFIAGGTRSQVHSLTADYVVTNILPEGEPTVKFISGNLLELDARGKVFDEELSDDLILGNLNPTAPGVTFEPVPGEPGLFRSTTAYSGQNVDLTWSGLNAGITDDSVTRSLAVEQLPPAPEISNLAIDCSSTFDCLSDWSTPYPVTFDVTDATDCTLTPTVISGGGTPGSTSPVIIDGINALSDYTSGSSAGDTIEIEANCNGPGGNATPLAIQLVLE